MPSNAFFPSSADLVRNHEHILSEAMMSAVLRSTVDVDAPRPGALSIAQMSACHSRFPGYGAEATCPAHAYPQAVRALWGGRISPMLASSGTSGRFAQAAIQCPPTACTGSLSLEAGARSQAWRNPQAQENIFCLDGELEIQVGPQLEHRVSLGRFDMLSVPANVRMLVRNAGSSTVHAVVSLSAPTATLAGNPFAAIFAASQAPLIGTEAALALRVGFDDAPGSAVDAQVLSGRVSRFATLVPYKKALSQTGGLPPEATQSLSASSVFPLIVPEGHKGRSRTAPMYGNQGLYISIAECHTSDDGPPPHSHSDTQETFFVLEGSFDICTGFDNESVVKARQFDVVSVPNKVQRAFINTSPGISRLLVLIQGPDGMNDTVWYSNRIGRDFERRFGPEVIAHYANIRMTFDAEERLGAPANGSALHADAPNHARTQTVILNNQGANVPTCLWLPHGQPQALVLACHGGSGHKASPAVLAIVDECRPKGIAVLAIDGPVHGDRRDGDGLDPATNRQRFRDAWKAGVGQLTMASDFSVALDWALRHPALANVSVGYIGVSMGTAYGIPLLALEKRIKAAAIGLWSTTYANSGHLREYAPQITCPIWFTQQWNDELFDRAGTAELFDLIGAADKRLVVYPGPHVELQGERLADAIAFIMQRLMA